MFLYVLVKDPALQQSPLPHFASFLQETAMKPSQVPNRLCHPPPRKMRMLSPLPSPELCHTDRLGPPRPPLCPEGLMHGMSGFVPSSPVNFGTRAIRPPPLPRDRLGPLQHSAQPPGSVYPARSVPVSHTHMVAAYNKPQTSPRFFHHASPHSRKDLSNHSLPPHIRRDQVTQSMTTLSNSGRKNVLVQQQESTKVLLSPFLVLHLILVITEKLNSLLILKKMLYL